LDPTHCLSAHDFVEAGTGAILFGGVDTAKYTGNLYNIAMYPDQYSGVIDSFTVSFTSISVTSASGTTSIDMTPQ
jgi:Eukaryotic aspartyl protease